MTQIIKLFLTSASLPVSILVDANESSLANPGAMNSNATRWLLVNNEKPSFHDSH